MYLLHTYYNAGTMHILYMYEERDKLTGFKRKLTDLTIVTAGVETIVTTALYDVAYRTYSSLT